VDIPPGPGQGVTLRTKHDYANACVRRNMMGTFVLTPPLTNFCFRDIFWTPIEVTSETIKDAVLRKATEEPDVCQCLPNSAPPHGAAVERIMAVLFRSGSS
jgi:hypothetical protein